MTMWNWSSTCARHKGGIEVVLESYIPKIPGFLGVYMFRHPHLMS